MRRGRAQKSFLFPIQADAEGTKCKKKVEEGEEGKGGI
jgi:hypothetical protein